MSRNEMKAYQVDKSINLWPCHHSEYKRHGREGWLKWPSLFCRQKILFHPFIAWAGCAGLKDQLCWNSWLWKKTCSLQCTDTGYNFMSLRRRWMRPWKISLDSDVLLITVLFGEKKDYSTPAGAFLCGIQEGAFQLIKGSIMVMQHFVWLIYSYSYCGQQMLCH